MATSFLRMVPLYSITIVCFSMSLAANSPRPWKRPVKMSFSDQPVQQQYFSSREEPRSPERVTEPDRRSLSTRSSSSGTEKIWDAPLEACFLLLGQRSGWTGRCCWIQFAAGAFTSAMGRTEENPGFTNGSAFMLSFITEQHSVLPDDQRGVRGAGLRLSAGTAGRIEHQGQLHQRVSPVTEGVPLAGLHSRELK